MIGKKKKPFFFDISAQKEDGGFELVTSASLDMVPANWASLGDKKKKNPTSIKL
jgi:hypothetical protein